ncbi:MAG: serine--tRNA ligase [Desulfovibrio sp.]|nr:MAG: serine--tRNA ligase [Desulfovibrio sp.]
MLDLKLLQKHGDVVQDGLAKRNSDIDLARFQELDAKRRSILGEVETLKSERNKASGLVAKAKRAGEDASDLIATLSTTSDRIKELDKQAAEVSAGVNDFLLTLPNVPHESVPVGKDENDNTLLSMWGDKPEFDFEPRDHHDLGVALDGLDFERAAKIAGARFAVYKGWAARLERALAAFMLDIHTGEHGYTEVMPPVIVNRQTMTGTGQLPKFGEDLFGLTGTDKDYFLIPTAEVPVTNLHSEETLAETDLPISYCAYTPCFRSEAGSYGKDTKGIIRQHQFQKVELVHFTRPEDSYDQLEKLREHAEEILKRLGLHYRVVTLCTGDMGFAAAKTYDIEVWLPSQDTYREISSCSNCEDFQARRANIRYRPTGAKKSGLPHTLNGSGLAVGRTFVAILENYQQADGSVVIPEALRPYMGGIDKIG